MLRSPCCRKQRQAVWHIVRFFQLFLQTPPRVVEGDTRRALQKAHPIRTDLIRENDMHAALASKQLRHLRALQRLPELVEHRFDVS